MAVVKNAIKKEIELWVDEALKGLNASKNKLLKENEIPYCVWNYLSTPNDGNRFSLVDDDNRKILSEELHRIILGEV